MYSEKVLDHFHHPRNVGELADATVVVEVENPACGDMLKLWASVSGDSFLAAAFKVSGCVPAVACGSWLAEWMPGKTVKEAARLSSADIEAALGGLPSPSRHASALARDAVRKVLADLAD